MSPAKATLYHFANRYLRQLLPSEYLSELEAELSTAERVVTEHPELSAWSQRALWLSHWDGVLAPKSEDDHIAQTLSTALLKNRQVIIHYPGKDQPFRFNVFSLVKRNDDLLVAGSYGQSLDPFVLSVRKIQAIELSNDPASQPAADFDLLPFLRRQLNFPLGEKIPCLQLEFSEQLYRYVLDHPLEADHLNIIAPEAYHHHGHFLLEAYGITDGERLRQWIRGFAEQAQVLKPASLRLAMEQARLDSRTNLLTANEFQRCLKRETQRCMRNGDLSFAVLIIDLDHFKQINDDNGHDFGDDVLLQVANCIREYDEAARHGGEEFCVLLPNTDATQANAIAERIRQLIEQQVLNNHHGTRVRVTASIGLAVYPDDLPEQLKLQLADSHIAAELSEKLCSALFHKAGQALYQAKHQGRNRIQMAAALG